MERGPNDIWFTDIFEKKLFLILIEIIVLISITIYFPGKKKPKKEKKNKKNDAQETKIDLENGEKPKLENGLPNPAFEDLVTSEKESEATGLSFNKVNLIVLRNFRFSCGQKS